MKISFRINIFCVGKYSLCTPTSLAFEYKPKTKYNFRTKRTGAGREWPQLQPAPDSRARIQSSDWCLCSRAGPESTPAGGRNGNRWKRNKSEWRTEAEGQSGPGCVYECGCLFTGWPSECCWFPCWKAHIWKIDFKQRTSGQQSTFLKQMLI